MRRVLLISSSRIHGSGYLEHCRSEVMDFLGTVKKLLFVPYALQDRDAYAASARKGFEPLGLELDSIHEVPDPKTAVEEADAMFVGGGNTFRLLKTIWELDLVDAIRGRVQAGMPYMGSSAGSNIACATIRTTNDMPIVQPPTFEALNLVPIQMNPHFIDASPDSTHMGETRETRLQEYLEENDLPVIALREGSQLRIEGDLMILKGVTGGKIFRRGGQPVEIAEGGDLSEFLRG